MTDLTHIAIIMDGNGRWAKNKGLARSLGHIEGAKTIEKIVDSCISRSIKVLSLFAFSTENWKRPDEEVSGIISLFNSYLNNKIKDFLDKDIQVRISGSLDSLKDDIKNTIANVIYATKNCSKMILNICFNYGSREEIIHAIKNIKDINSIDEESFSKLLYNSDLPSPDLIIRTGGKKRLSNFMLYQAAYAELYFTDKFWPDFNCEDLDKAIEYYKNTDRNFGDIKC